MNEGMKNCEISLAEKIYSKVAADLIYEEMQAQDNTREASEEELNKRLQERMQSYFILLDRAITAARLFSQAAWRITTYKYIDPAIEQVLETAKQKEQTK